MSPRLKAGRKPGVARLASPGLPRPRHGGPPREGCGPRLPSLRLRAGSAPRAAAGAGPRPDLWASTSAAQSRKAGSARSGAAFAAAAKAETAPAPSSSARAARPETIRVATWPGRVSSDLRAKARASPARPRRSAAMAASSLSAASRGSRASAAAQRSAASSFRPAFRASTIARHGVAARSSRGHAGPGHRNGAGKARTSPE